MESFLRYYYSKVPPGTGVVVPGRVILIDKTDLFKIIFTGFWAIFAVKTLIMQLSMNYLFV